jgi:hypothetical protein
MAAASMTIVGTATMTVITITSRYPALRVLRFNPEQLGGIPAQDGAAVSIT